MLNMIKCGSIIFLFFLKTFTVISQNRDNTDVHLILKNFNNFWAYYNHNINLCEDFISLDQYRNEISKINFLENLKTEKYIPLRLDINNKKYYQLFRINSKNYPDIIGVVRQMAEYEINHLALEGKKLPNFNFTDLNNKIYTLKSTKGKIVVMKFWFINCGKCVKEMPFLNKMVKQYSNRKDIVFLSLVYDNRKDIGKFLLKNKFDYQIVLNQKAYLNDELKIDTYPTHLVIGKNGLVLKVFDTAEQVEKVLAKL